MAPGSQMPSTRGDVDAIAHQITVAFLHDVAEMHVVFSIVSWRSVPLVSVDYHWFWSSQKAPGGLGGLPKTEPLQRASLDVTRVGGRFRAVDRTVEPAVAPSGRAVEKGRGVGREIDRDHEKEQLYQELILGAGKCNHLRR
jgi:hypothetical protein